MHKYRAFGLDISSEFELEHLDPSSESSYDLLITAEDLSPQRREHALDAVERAFLSTDAGAVMHWRDVGTVLVSGGDRMLVDFDASVDLSTRTLALSGPPMGVLLEQRGLLVLHASAVTMDERAVAFLGHKGFGKSTTAAALAQAGHPVLTDDILAIDTTTPELLVSPGMPVLKLWPSSQHAIYGGDEEEAEDQIDKHVLPTLVNQTRSYPLGALFVLDMGETAAERITGKTAFLDVIRNSYSSRFVGTAGTPPDHFIRCSRVASDVPVFKLKRTPTLDSLPNVVAVVEETVRNL